MCDNFKEMPSIEIKNGDVVCQFIYKEKALGWYRKEHRISLR